MPTETPQTYDTHVQSLPLGYKLSSAAVVAALAIAVAQLVVHPSWAGTVAVFLCIGVGGAIWQLRVAALRVQDRVIRLEERLRLAELLPDDLRARIPELTLDQLVALRFAADSELPELTRRVLSEGLADRKAIKRLVTSWRPDRLRV